MKASSESSAKTRQLPVLSSLLIRAWGRGGSSVRLYIPVYLGSHGPCWEVHSPPPSRTRHMGIGALSWCRCPRRSQTRGVCPRPFAVSTSGVARWAKKKYRKASLSVRRRDDLRSCAGTRGKRDCRLRDYGHLSSRRRGPVHDGGLVGRGAKRCLLMVIWQPRSYAHLSQRSDAVWSR